MTLNSREIREVLTALETSDWDQAVVTVGDVTISVARDGLDVAGAGGPSGTTPASAAPVATPQAATTDVADPPRTATSATGSAPDATSPAEQLTPVTSPSVGVFWSSPQPGSPPFVTAGDHVDAGQTLCIIEIMKLMSEVAAPVAGTVREVLATNAEQVEYGTVLFTIEPDA